MRKNRIIWNVALFIVVIAMLPAAYAQSATGSWFFVLINAAIVGVVLFILQAFLIPKKEPKEQTVAWVAIIAASLVIAFFFGRSGFLWQGPLGRFLDIHIIVNTFIIGIVGYFALGLLKVKENIKSPEGNVGYGLLIFIGALVWAIGIQNSYGPVFIWQAYQYFISYFIGPEGILNPYPPQYRLLVFAGSFMLLAFFFQQYLITGGDKKVNYALALILSMQMASSGVTVKSVIILGEIIFILVLQKALAAGPANKPWASWLLAIGLVGWASAAMTYGTEYQGAVATPIGWIMSWFGLVQAGTTAQPTSISWWAKILLVVFVLIVIIGSILFAMGRRKGGVRDWLRKYGLAPLLRQMRKNPVGPIKWLLGRWTGKDPYLEGHLPFVFQDLRAELMILMNYQTRLHTYLGKRGGVAEFDNQAGGIEANFKTASKTYDSMRKSLDEKYRFGGEDVAENSYGWSNNRQLIASFFEQLKKNLEADLDILKVSPVPAEERSNISRNLESTFNQRLNLMAGAYGQFITNTKRVGLIHRLRSLKIKLLDLLALYGAYKHYYRFANENALFEKWDWELQHGEAIPVKRDKNYEDKKKKIIDSVRKSIFNRLLSQKIEDLRKKLYQDYYDEIRGKLEPIIRQQYDRYKETLKVSERDKITENVIKRNIKKAVELREREIRVRVEAELRNRQDDIGLEVLEELENDDIKKEILKSLPESYKLGFVATLDQGKIRHEVDVKGFVLEDMHKIEVDGKKKEELPFVRRVKIEDIEDFAGDTPELSTFSFIVPKILAEWDFLIEDLRFGTFHPFSRSHIDYTKIVNEQRSLNFENAGRTKPDRRQNYAAFDLEALKISGKWVYWGRRNYWDALPEQKNPYPTLSTIGLSRFITEIVRLRAKDSDLADKYLSYWVWDTSREDQPFTSLLGKEKEQ
ncbi:hypothetical protein HYX08_06575 [Candidatus Woesearchaeota archaeon]|nr:hypothetical protein [Candidatus Woesearchaeota archaeon]